VTFCEDDRFFFFFYLTVLCYRDMEVWYNYDDNKETWRAGSGGWQNVKLTCNARGGRPEPNIR
jgi:hypothetical protein